jgi:endonuclease/exonuclease/phosphatase family metal-dependent hydrolase
VARQVEQCTVAAVALAVLTWNLFHGRAVPAAGRPLLGAFARALAGWEWDVALLQEVPPWWPEALAAATGSEAGSVLTARNGLLGARRAVASRRPDLLRSNGGGANAILSRRGVKAHAARRLCRWPERRWAHGVRLADGTWVVNLHASTPPAPRAERDVRRAAGAALGWAGGAPLVLGGDFNLREPLLPGFGLAASHHVDHVLLRGWRALEPGRTLERGALSDHAPLLVRAERV